MREVKAHSANRHGSPDKNSGGSTFVAPKNQNSLRDEHNHDQPIQAKSIFSDQPAFFQPVQTKLSIGKPGDKYEQEADAVADKVVSKTVSQTVQPAPLSSEQAHKIQTKTQVTSNSNNTERIQEEAKTEEQSTLAEGISPVTFSSPSDQANNEASIGRMPVQRKCAECAKKEKEESESLSGNGRTGMLVQRKCDKCAAEDEKKIQRQHLTGVQRKSTASQSSPAGFEENLNNSRGGRAEE